MTPGILAENVIKTLRVVQSFFATRSLSLFFPRLLYAGSQMAAIMYGFLPGGTLRYLDRLQPLALVVMRLTLGVIMVAHGYHKVFGGLQHHAQFVASLGLPAWLGYVSAFAEFLGGILVLVGFFTRAAAFVLLVDLLVAIWKVHWHNGLTGDHGYEFPLAVAALAFVLIFFGSGAISFDHVLRGGGAGGFRGS
jgi:putative oxidoreductase